jgi:hypothetical protein
MMRKREARDFARPDSGLAATQGLGSSFRNIRVEKLW